MLENGGFFRYRQNTVKVWNIGLVSSGVVVSSTHLYVAVLHAQASVHDSVNSCINSSKGQALTWHKFDSPLFDSYCFMILLCSCFCLIATSWTTSSAVFYSTSILSRTFETLSYCKTFYHNPLRMKQWESVHVLAEIMCKFMWLLSLIAAIEIGSGDFIGLQSNASISWLWHYVKRK